MTAKTHREHLFCFISCLFCFSRSELLHTFNGPFLGFQGLPTWAVTRKVKPIWILMKQETVSGSGISWDICKSAPRSRQITMPAPHHSVFYRPDALHAAQPTVSKHWRHGREKEKPSLFWPWFLWSVQFQENHYNCCHQMSYFKTKMHQFDFSWGCTQEPARGAFSAPPDRLAGLAAFKGAYF